MTAMAVTIKVVETEAKTVAETMSQLGVTESVTMADIGIATVSTQVTVTAYTKVGVSTVAHAKVTGTIMTSTIHHIDLQMLHLVGLAAR